MSGLTLCLHGLRLYSLSVGYTPERLASSIAYSSSMSVSGSFLLDREHAAPLGANADGAPCLAIRSGGKSGCWSPFEDDYHTPTLAGKTAICTSSLT